MSRTILILALLLATPAWSLETVAGGGACHDADPRSAYVDASSIDVDGETVYIGSGALNRILRIVRNGAVERIENVAGTGLPLQAGQPVSNRAHEQSFTINGIAVSPGGIVYAAVQNQSAIYRINGPDLEVFATPSFPVGVTTNATHLWTVGDGKASLYPLACQSPCAPLRVVTGLTSAVDVAVSDDGALVYVLEQASSGRVRRINADGSLTTIVSGLSIPKGIALAPNGDIYVALFDLHRINRIRDGVMTTIAGTGSPQNLAAWVTIGPGQPATSQPFTFPTDVAVSDDGRWLYIANAPSSTNIDKRIRRLDLAAGPVPTVTSTRSPVPTDTIAPTRTATLAPSATRTAPPTFTRTSPPPPTATATQTKVPTCAPGESPSCQAPTL